MAAEAALTGTKILETKALGVRFGGLNALRHVDLDVHEGDIFGVIGPNGAGKNDLLQCREWLHPTYRRVSHLFRPGYYGLRSPCGGAQRIG